MEGFEKACNTSSSDNFQSLALSLLDLNLKKVDFRLCMQFKAKHWRFDSIEPKLVTKVLKIKY